MPSKPESADVVALKTTKLRAALQAARGDVRAAAAALGLHEATAWRQIERYELRAWLDEAYPSAERSARGRRRQAEEASEKKVDRSS